MCDGNDVADTHLYLQVAAARSMVVSEEHEAVMRDDVGVIRVAIERHLTADSFFSRGDGYLFTFFIDDELARFTAHKAAGPEHKRDYLAFEALFAQALTKVVGQPANGGAGFVGIGGMMEAHTGILAQWRGIGDDETHILAASHQAYQGCNVIPPGSWLQPGRRW